MSVVQLIDVCKRLANNAAAYTKNEKLRQLIININSFIFTLESAQTILQRDDIAITFNQALGAANKLINILENNNLVEKAASMAFASFQEAEIENTFNVFEQCFKMIETQLGFVESEKVIRHLSPKDKTKGGVLEEKWKVAQKFWLNNFGTEVDSVSFEQFFDALTFDFHSKFSKNDYNHYNILKSHREVYKSIFAGAADEISLIAFSSLLNESESIESIIDFVQSLLKCGFILNTELDEVKEAIEKEKDEIINKTKSQAVYYIKLIYANKYSEFEIVTPSKNFNIKFNSTKQFIFADDEQIEFETLSEAIDSRKNILKLPIILEDYNEQKQFNACGKITNINKSKELNKKVIDLPNSLDEIEPILNYAVKNSQPKFAGLSFELAQTFTIISQQTSLNLLNNINTNTINTNKITNTTINTNTINTNKITNKTTTTNTN
eukprot:TRINITY_DN4347_c0_g1_i1.p1 TRINITY_DN4347_c0_g1~~TRINITY_DN4347_c0_g1_i1.p1  ORF type:complete len:438 (-),score=145.83 TRINITY_DN4347_c0_g1_i1:101-1414(-)